MTFNPYRVEVYVLQAEQSGLLKIGRCHPGYEKDRLKAAEKAIKERCRFVCYLDRHERQAHHDLAPHRYAGEWFRSRQPVLDYINQYGSDHYCQRENQ